MNILKKPDMALLMSASGSPAHRKILAHIIQNRGIIHDFDMR